MNLFKKKEVRNAFIIGFISSVAYMFCYFARNILSVMSPEIVETTTLTVEYIGTLSTVNMFSYAIGQLINGVIGDKIKGKYLVSGGLILAGICSAIIGLFDSKVVVLIAYGMVGFFLSMFYAPLTKLIAESMHPSYAMNCCLGLTLASYLGTPMAGIVALFFDWKGAFVFAGGVLGVAGVVFYLSIHTLEKKGIVKFLRPKKSEKKGGGIRVLIENGIIKFSVVSILTGIVRTSVVFWIPTYLSQYLGFSAGISATIFTLITCLQSVSPYVTNLILYERVLKRNMNQLLLLSFATSTISFLLMFMMHQPYLNIFFLVVALLSSGAASNAMWSIYCPSLGHTGMVSTATGYLDFLSYMAAAIANQLFANAISVIGWGKLILVWTGLMLVGVLVSMPKKIRKSVDFSGNK